MQKNMKYIFKRAAAVVVLGIPIEMILTVFDLQVAPILPIEFRVNWPLGLRSRISKYIFKKAAVASILYFWYNDIAIFDQPVTLVIPTKLPVNWSFGSGEKIEKNSFWRLWRLSLISGRNSFSYILTSLSRTRLFRITAYLEVKIWSLF